MTGGAIRIEDAKPEQAGLLTDLCLRSKQSNGYDDAFMAACRDELTVTADHLRTQQWWVAIDEQTSVICGCVGLIPSTDPDLPANSGEVHAFFIDPKSKRQGVGRMLWETLNACAQDQGFASLVLYADPNAVPFYETMGFIITGQAPSGSIAGRMLPQMSINLRRT